MLRGHSAVGQDVIEFAVPHTLAFTFFPAWVSSLREKFGPIKSRLIALNVHDAVMRLVEGGCDLLMCYHHPRQPVQLDPARYDMLMQGGDSLILGTSHAFSEWTGRAVLDVNLTPDNLLYASYSRGYKSGGINPPLSVGFGVPESFKPEFVNAFEIGSKNTFAGGKFRLNLTAFYYQYKALQLSRIVARTSVNDNVDAVKAEIAQTVSDLGNVREELEALMAALR